MLDRYWKLVRLNPSGGHRIVVLALAQAHLEQQFPHGESLTERSLQGGLFQQFQSGDAQAGLCLRCAISHYIWQECRSLARQYGEYYQFSESDLLPYVLDDDGALTIDRYCPLSLQILQRFNPELSQLNTWTSRLVRQHRELVQFLKQQGLWLITDWALLNDTAVARLQRLLNTVYHLTEAEITQAACVLESYRAIYLPAHLAAGGGTCAEPSLAQLQGMADYLQAHYQLVLAPPAILGQLRQLAKWIRDYRLGKVKLPPPAPPVTEDPEITAFLERYQAQFQQALRQAIAQVICDRLKKFSTPERANTFLSALRLSYCDRLTQTEIAQRLALRQDQVARLLALKDLRAAIRRHMLITLKNDVLKAATQFADAEQLRQFDQQIEAVLDQEVTDLLQEDQRQSYTTQSYMTGSRLSQPLCAYVTKCEV